MELQKRKWQIGAAVLACALLLRMAASGLPKKAVAFLSDPKVMALFLYLETGYLMRPAPQQSLQQPPEEDVPETVPPETEQVQLLQPVFAPDDAALVEVNSVCGYDADLPALLQYPLQWELKQQTPTVLILHTHGTESYEKTEDYTESSAYRTLDTDYNVVSVGTYLASLLEAGGIRVIHDTTMHDYPSYTGSYNHAREAMEMYLQENPGICMVLDIHRDAVEDATGQMRFTVEADGQAVARLMMVVGTDAGGLTHPDWPENMSLAVKLHAQLEKNTPGICRPISFRTQRFNQDLSPGALIVEVGSAGNTRQEALRGVEKLAQAILALSAGTAVTEDFSS